MSQVAPYMGAWIEIEDILRIPSVELVAPYMGAWIEMGYIDPYKDPHKDVAPYMGAWIEIIW